MAPVENTCAGVQPEYRETIPPSRLAVFHEKHHAAQFSARRRVSGMCSIVELTPLTASEIDWTLVEIVDAEVVNDPGSQP
jgi:hypothetical protein